MYRPLVDIDTNSRRPGFRSFNPPCKATSPMAQTSASSERGRIPFGVSTSGSPRYVAHSSTSKSNMSPAASSRIPRKAPTPTSIPRQSGMGAGVAPHRLVLPKSRGTKPLAAAPSAIPKPRHSPNADRDKPLPSPPIAQVVDPSSPPKAQRTLIDAEVAGTPTSEEWPIISPDNVSRKTKDSPNSQTSSKSAVTRTTSDTISRMEIRGANFNAARSASAPPSSPPVSASAASYKVSRERGTLLHQSSPSTSTPVVHALTTADNEALESPLAHKFAVPPRSSSKRTSLPLATKGSGSPAFRAALAASTRRGQTKPGSTKWPLLDTGYNDPTSSKPRLAAKRDCSARRLPGNGTRAVETQEHHEPKPLKAYHPMLPSQDSSSSTSTWSLSAGSSAEAEPRQENDPSGRFKRLSAHSATSGLGPILRIAEDADSVLLGDGACATALSAVPYAGPGKASEERSLNAMGRISRQTLSRLSVNTDSRSNTPQSNRDSVNKSLPIEVSSVESARLGRQANVETEPNKRPPTLQPLLTPQKAIFVEPDSSPFEESPPIVCDTREGKKTVSLSEDPAVAGWGQETSNVQALPLKLISPKHTQVLDFGFALPDDKVSNVAETAKHSPKDGLSRARESTANRSKTSPSLIRSAQRNSRNMTMGARSPASHPLSPSSTAHFSSEGSFGPSKLRSTESITPAKSVTAMEQHQVSICATDKAIQRPKSDYEPSIESKDSKNSQNKNDKTAKDTAAKIKAKRSFRDFFTKREGKGAEKVSKPVETKRSSLTMPGGTLAKRFRNSANLSKVNVTKATGDADLSYSKTAITQTKARTHKSSRQDEARSSTPEVLSATSSDTVVIVNNIIERISSLPDNSPDRLRGLEIAEVCKTTHNRSLMLKELVLTARLKQAVLNSVDAYKQAKISAMRAKQHAREAELNAERAGVELERLQTLCEPGFGSDAVLAIKELVKGVSSIGSEHLSLQSSEISATAR